MKNIIFVVAVIVSAAAVASEAPYVGQEAREIKALSQQEIDGYLNGRGMGYAKAAELNSYPGPLHVLELAEKLALTDEQLKQTRALYERMKDEAVTLGRQLVEKERELDRKFAGGPIDTQTLNALVSGIGALEAKIRYAHLAAHLEQQALLSRRQIQLYDRLRGYEAGHGHSHHGH